MYKHLLSMFSVLVLASSCGSEATTEESGATAASEQPAAPPQSNLGEAATTSLMTVVTDYYQLKDALVATDAMKTDEAANKLSSSVEALRTSLLADSTSSENLVKLLDTIAINTKLIVAAQDPTTEQKRVHFEFVSNAMFSLLKEADLKHAGVYRQYCPMAFNDKGAYWLSNEEGIRNPYFGKKMLECGEVTDSLK